ncbi:MAG: 1-acyl-sn-glycerol-3-phosphate acyltransferase [Phycisphaerae bacterium]|nr:MAG: 1-acyl-sn-glycerol-3-phosphate acyltransferase [Phycisphaerae bacterium]
MIEAPKKLIYRASTIALGGLFSLTCRVRLFGREHLPPRGPLLLACNHQSFLDPPLVGSLAGRPLHYMARDSLFRVPGLSALIRMHNAFPVKTNTADLSSFKMSLRILKAGGALLVFPEGTRSPDGKISECQPGIIHLMRRANVPILPVAIEGVFEAWPRSAIMPRPSPLWIEFGRLIGPAAFEGQEPAQAASQLTQHLRQLHNQVRIRAGRAPIGYAGDH